MRARPFFLSFFCSTVMCCLSVQLFADWGPPPPPPAPRSYCGDGIVEWYEECDDGNAYDWDECVKCLVASCGDGAIWWGYEQCDDGNTNDGDDCPTTCQYATCGDGFVYLGEEECDDGDDDNTDECLENCLLPFCGDGHIQQYVEQCDDGNQEDDDNCNSNCEKVFSSAYARIATFNAALLVDNGQGKELAGCVSDIFGAPDYICMVQKMAPRIFASDYDVLIFNEVTDETARDSLVAHLQGSVANGKYPYVVYLLDEDNDPEDSGLMLFSRWPFMDLYVEPLSCDNNQLGLDDIQFNIDGTEYIYPGLLSNPPAKVGFRPFTYCKGSNLLSGKVDCFSAKGVGYVRLRGPDNLPFNIFFTHLNASYPCDFDSGIFPEEEVYAWCLAEWQDYFQTREGQLQEIREFMNCMLPSIHWKDEAVLLAGDFNINGDLSNGYMDVTTLPVLDDQMGHVRNEYDNNFVYSPAGNGFFYDNILKEVWTHAMTPHCDPAYPGAPLAPECAASTPFKGAATYDRGFTWHDPDSEDRLDYWFMYNQVYVPRNKLCAQHVTKAWNLWTGSDYNSFEGGMTNNWGYHGRLSDHFGLNIELEYAAPYCNPSEALVDPPSDTELTLTHAKSFVWIKFNKKGTYAFNVNPKWQVPAKADNGIDYRIYTGSDFSKVALSNYGEVIEVEPKDQVCTASNCVPGEEGYISKEFKIVEAPFYVKVYHPGDTLEPGYDGNFTFHYQRNDCTSVKKACVLYPFDSNLNKAEDALTFEATAPGEAWFKMTVDQGNSYTPQKLHIFAAVDESQPAWIHKIEVFRNDASTAVSGYATEEVEVESVASGAKRLVLNIGPSKDGQLDGNKVTYYLKVSREHPVDPNLPVPTFQYWVGWKTSLLYLLGGEICCLENQELYDDEIMMTFASDLHPMPVSGSQDAATWLPMAVMDVDACYTYSDKMRLYSGLDVHGRSSADVGGLVFAEELGTWLADNDTDDEDEKDYVGVYSCDDQICDADDDNWRAFLGPFIWYRWWDIGGGLYQGRYQGSFVLTHVQSELPCEIGDCTPPYECKNHFCR